MRSIKQGEIYLADLSHIVGHKQGGYRPVMILQNNILNKNLNTVIIIPITKNLNAKGLLSTFFLDKKISKLELDSLALIYQIRTIDKSRLKKYVSIIDDYNFDLIKEQLYFLLG